MYNKSIIVQTANGRACYCTNGQRQSSLLHKRPAVELVIAQTASGRVRYCKRPAVELVIALTASGRARYCTNGQRQSALLHKRPAVELVIAQTASGRARQAVSAVPILLVVQKRTILIFARPAYQYKWERTFEVNVPCFDTLGFLVSQVESLNRYCS